MNMPKWVSNGFMPSPSSGMKGSLSKGLAMKPITAMKNVITSINTPVVYGNVSRTLCGALHTANAAMAPNAMAMYNSDPSLPA